ncbi:MAG TPA: peptidylprolyl isomerase [Sedimentisphaerales bacterium]|nr:peptidylprolyl isomerase [Sedimentisphaerales bacterium]HRS12116.1 peptidylprolyl isomerase [Sedimentisphaerales bacterium]HRV48714.1 peptidylprolyl isomerase [Sedimentisphaerales bacterium]
MKTEHTSRILLFVAVVTIGAVFLAGCRPSKVGPENGGVSADPSLIVATIGDDSITRGELTERLSQSIRPQRDGSAGPQEPVTAQSVLREMLMEKAMVLEGRALGYAADEAVSASVERYRQRKLTQAFLGDYIREHVPVSQEEIDEKIKADPNLTPEQARMKVLSTKWQPVYQALYAELLKKFEVKKVERNFARAAQIHQRLLTQPVEPRGRTVFWITNHQIQTELSRDERDIVLATYTGGQFTLYDWFKTLNEIAPPGRSKDLSTPAGVEKLLNRGLEPTIVEAEAVARGYDKKDELIRDIRAREDMTILGKMRTDQYKEVPAPTDEEIKAYFDQNPERFAAEATLKIDQIWCQDLPTAEQVKKSLEGGVAFAALKAEQSLRAGEPEHNVYPSSEGVFWNELWRGEPNDIIGPVKGFFDEGIKWRVVKILEKTPAQMRPYSDSLKNQVQSALTTQRFKDHMERYGASLLAKYPHRIYAERIQDIDPFEVTATSVASRP